MRLQKGQREAVLRWVAEGLQSDEINKRAAEFSPPFQIDRRRVDYYRRTRSARIKEIQQAGETEALTTGLAVKGERVAVLQKVANRMIADVLGDSLWVSDVKAVGMEKVYIERFNAAEVSELRAVLDQIASEVGDKKQEQLIPSKIEVIFKRMEGQE